VANTHRLAPPLVLACLALALTVSGCGGSAGAQPQAAAKTTAFAGNALDPPLETTSFSLHDQDGKVVTLAQQRGRLAILAFLYTHCPDVCPLIAQNLNLALRQLTPAERARVRVLAISVDPKGDTKAAVRKFVFAHRLRPEFRYLTGTRAELSRVWRAYHVAASGNLESIDHSAYELLVDGKGAGRVLYDAQVTPRQVVHDVRALLAR